MSLDWFGATLLMIGGDGILSMILVSWLINRWGSARILSWTALLAGACLPFLALVLSFWSFVLVLARARRTRLDGAGAAHADGWDEEQI